MAKRNKLTRTRAEAVDRFVKALREEVPDVDDIVMLTEFVKDYKSGAPLVPGNYRKFPAGKKPILCKKKKAPWWKILLGIHD